MYALGAAHVDRERGRGDSPDERVSLSASTASTAGAQQVRGEWGMQPGRESGSRPCRPLTGL